MSYYDEDKGYVGYDPYEAAEKNRHEKLYHKSNVKTVTELCQSLYTSKFVDESKKYIEEPVSTGDWFLDGFSKAFYEHIGDFHKTFELMSKDRIANCDKPQLLYSTSEFIVSEGTETYIVYKVTKDGLEIIGVFFDKDCAEKIIKK